MAVRLPHDPVAMPILSDPVEVGKSRPHPLGSETVGHTGVDAMMGGLSILAVGLVIGVAIAWVLRFSPNSFRGGIARISWIDFFESKGFGASFGGLVSVVTFQIAGVNALSTFAITLLIVVGYWLAFDKPR
jgi:hypothetical protein